MSTIVRSASPGPISARTWWALRFGSSRRNRLPPGGSSSAIRAAAAAPVTAASARLARPPRRAANPARALAPASSPIGHQKVPFASGSSSTRTSRAPASRSSPASHSAARRSPSDADSRGPEQSSSRRSRIHAASGGREAPVGALVAMAGNLPALPNITGMGTGGGVTLFRIRGIRIAVDYSWFVVLFLIIFWLSGFYKDVLDEPKGSSAPYLLAVASATLFFASILLHELGHAFVARRHNIGVSGITLWMFGGFARLEKDSDTPGTEFKIAIAGPLVTAAIVVACFLAGLLLAGDEFRHAALAQSVTRTSGIAAMVSWLGSINLFVLIFNLVPAFPLDGGRIARAIAWWRTGSRNSGTRFAATLGEWFGVLMIIGGLGYFLAYRGDVFGGVWLAFIGFILRGAAKAALAQTAVTSRIEGISVADVMDRDPVAIPEGASIEQALDEYFLRYRSPWFPVVDTAQRFIGLVDRGAADNVPAVERTSSVVSDVLARDSGSLTIGEDEPLESVLGNEALRRLGALIATDSEGHIRGVLTIDAIGKALRPVAPGSADTSL